MLGMAVTGASLRQGTMLSMMNRLHTIIVLNSALWLLVVLFVWALL